MKTLKPTTPTSTVQKVTGPPLEMEIPPQIILIIQIRPQIPVPAPQPTAARPLLPGNTACQ